MPRVSLENAIEEVRLRDPVLNRLVAKVGLIRHRPKNPHGHFGTLARAIVFQQLAGRAAATILERVIAAAGGELSARALARVSDRNLRAAGLSANKLAALRDLSAKTSSGDVDLESIARQTDEEIIAALTTIRGIGRWTAEMYLLFELRRLDVWPVDDLGVRMGYGLTWKLEPPPTAKQLAPLGDRFRPYRSVVARYCWEAVGLSRAAQ